MLVQEAVRLSGMCSLLMWEAHMGMSLCHRRRFLRSRVRDGIIYLAFYRRGSSAYAWHVEGYNYIVGHAQMYHDIYLTNESEPRWYIYVP